MASADFDPYAVLGISPNAAPDEIRAAYRHLAAACHPDTQPQERKTWATEQMVRLNAARDLLLNTRRRVHYHREHTDTLRWQMEKNRWQAGKAHMASARHATTEAYAPRRRWPWLVFMLAGCTLFSLALLMLPFLMGLVTHPEAAAEFSARAPEVIMQQSLAWLTSLGGFALAALAGVGAVGFLVILFFGLTFRWGR